jgi:hypothetical protein
MGHFPGNEADINLKKDWSLTFTPPCLRGVVIKCKNFISREDEIHRYEGGCRYSFNALNMQGMKGI